MNKSTRRKGEEDGEEPEEKYFTKGERGRKAAT